MPRKIEKDNIRKPEWFKIKAPLGTNYREVRSLMESYGLHTVCQEANCPNRAECYGARTATFLILGDICTRGCTFCNVRRGRPREVLQNEPERVAEAAGKLGLKYVVVTSVTRDDLPDGGASLFADTIEAVRAVNRGCRVEVLIPDFRGNFEALKTVLDAKPDVLNHNIETIERLYPAVRKGADYKRSLELISRVRSYSPGIPTKSGLMVGLGEMFDEIRKALEDLHQAGCRLLTIGQYLSPSKKHHPVIAYYSPEEFDELKKMALEIGFDGVVSGPLIRSSYRASMMYSNSGSKH
ncbi:MAG TPA: lipoyl synthase [candidate division Zixibacteria bacterium]|nr:lipoyl synthase [candidate division Zixibacteria bacterium]HEQ99009.1 lipoyl synthase [candidate division Zixibacteria bacterium]